jgi:shikimate kinase
MPVINRTPYRNLILTGTLGTGKTGVGRRISDQMEGAAFIDMEVEIQNREGYTVEQIRETFGLARVRSLENQMVGEITLRRSTVLAISGLTLMEPSNLERLRETGPVLCLTAALGEILRRLHVAQGGRFHDRETRAAAIGRLKREGQVLTLDLPKLDTTGVKIENVVQKAIEFWLSESDI